MKIYNVFLVSNQVKSICVLVCSLRLSRLFISNTVLVMLPIFVTLVLLLSAKILFRMQSFDALKTSVTVTPEVRVSPVNYLRFDAVIQGLLPDQCVKEVAKQATIALCS
jgi:hypothetical protein